MRSYTAIHAIRELQLKNADVLSIRQMRVKIIEDIPDNDYESLLRRHFVSKGRLEGSHCNGISC